MSKKCTPLSHKVIITCGGSFQGKSLIALHIANKFKIPLVISTDTIRNILHITDPKIPHLSTSTYLMTPADLFKQMNIVSKVLRELIVIYEKRGEDIVIEGMHLSQSFIEYCSDKSNILIFCVNNKLPFKKKLEYKSRIRHRVEYFEPKTSEIKYGALTKNNIDFTSYMKYANRINEIHQQIITWLSMKKLTVINYKDINKAIISIDTLITDWLANMDKN